MIKNVLKKVFGDKSQKDQKEYQPFIDATNEEFQKLSGLSNDELRNKTTELKKRIADEIATDENEIKQLKEKAEDENTDVFEKEKIYDDIDAITKDIDKKIEVVLKEILPEAFAVVKETARRFKENDEIIVTASDFDKELASSRNSIKINGDKAHWKTTWDAAGSEVSWDMVHYDVQLMGGAVLHFGKIAEMQTGEGKTLVSTLPVYLNALAGKGVHLVTVNDYLAKRDSEWMGPIYEFHGMSVDCIDKHQPNTESRRKAYEADITYGTNNEFGFDYLRDNMGSDPDQLVQKKHHYAIIDEVDSVLIDDARTPLIISGPTPQGDKHEYVELKPKIDQLYNVQKKLVTQLLADAKRKLKAAEDESIDKKEQKTLLEEGGVALLRAHRGLPKNKALIKFLSEPGIKIHLQKTENIYMAEQNKRMPEIDKELFFVIDEKNNGIELMDKGIDLLADKQDSDQYTLPDIGSLIADLEKQDLPKEELLEKKDAMMRDFTIKSERIHTMNQLLKAYALFEKEVDYVVMDNKVKIVDEQTGRIMEGRRYSDGLHMAIEAKENVSVEAATQTYATITLQNYFRMYHKLAGMTGTAETEAKEFWDIYELDVIVIPTNKPVVRNDENDMVYKTAREKYNAIIDETMRMVEAGRPVLVGTTTVEISELLSRMLKMKGIKHQVLNAKYHQREAEIVAEAGKAGTVTIATNMAGRGTDIKLGEGVKDAGGLAIIGTERHDSRRVDRQLRGRSGRQGDPGSSQFFVSLEDNLMRLFGSERIAKLMDRMGLKEGEVIQHSMITRSIERAQKKVEENNFGIRKRLLEYDDVMNAQRKAIYKKRKHALFGERLEMDIANMFFDTSEAIISVNHPYKDYENFELDILREFSIDSPFTEDEFINGNPAELTDKLAHAAQQRYVEKMGRLANKAYPIIKQVYENESGKYKNMVFPVSDGTKSMQVIVNLEKAYEQKGAPLKLAIEKNITLGIIDNEWKEHLREMDDLRQSVQQAVYEQKDPLLIYKLESYELFKKMADRMNREIISFLTKVDLPEQQTEVKSTNQEESSSRDNYANSQTTNTEVPEIAGREGYDQAMQNSQQQQQQKTQPIKRTEKKVGRNDPCPCGSGKKYKQCHGK